MLHYSARLQGKQFQITYSSGFPQITQISAEAVIIICVILHFLRENLKIFFG